MSKLNDSSAIKLFGKTIPLLTLNQDDALADLISGVNSNDGVQAQAPMEDQESIAEEFLNEKQEDSTHNENRDDLRDSLAEVKSSKNEEVRETTSSQDKTLKKKPDKLLPCPRCSSKETKFCYYNNYSVNQPRHFCKNCQRYWTAGGTMRNVPVGAGRRKTKSSSALHYHHIMVSEAIRAAQASAASGIHRNFSCENNYSRVLTFGSDSSVPIASGFNLSGKKEINVQNGIHKPEQRILVENNQALDKNYQWFPPCFTRPSWPFPWNSIQWNTAMLPAPPIVSPPGFPVSFPPAPTYSNYSLPNPSDAPSYSPTSATLGKHSRDENIVSPANLEKENPSGESNKSEGGALNSKTMKIDDPGEAAKSSMLATLVIKSKKTNSINSGSIFDGFQSKGSDEQNYRLETLSVLRANPAALSRSLKFHDNQ